jgi:hypothetical protein
MRIRLVALLAAMLTLAACSGDDPELSTDSTIVTGGTNAPAPTPSTTTAGTGEGTSPSTTLAGQSVETFEVVANIPNDQGVAQHIVIPNGAYTDVDLENFIIELIDSNPDLYGAEIFDDADAAAAFAVDPAQRTEDQAALIERHHFLSLIGRDRIEFRGPFAEFPGGAIGS